jgi:hypothetical protein
MMTNHRSLEVSASDGRVLAGYLTFGRQPGEKSVRTNCPAPGLVVDYGADDRPIGLEITAPSMVTLEAINRALVALGQPPATADELAPLFGPVRQ